MFFSEWLALNVEAILTTTRRAWARQCIICAIGRALLTNHNRAVFGACAHSWDV